MKIFLLGAVSALPMATAAHASDSSSTVTQSGSGQNAECTAEFYYGVTPFNWLVLQPNLQ